MTNQLTTDIIAAFRKAKSRSAFLQTFADEIETIIAQHTAPFFLRYQNVYQQLSYIQLMCRSRHLKAKHFLRAVRHYVEWVIADYNTPVKKNERLDLRKEIMSY